MIVVLVWLSVNGCQWCIWETYPWSVDHGLQALAGVWKPRKASPPRLLRASAFAGHKSGAGDATCQKGNKLWWMQNSNYHQVQPQVQPPSITTKYGRLLTGHWNCWGLHWGRSHAVALATSAAPTSPEGQWRCHRRLRGLQKPHRTDGWHGSHLRKRHCPNLSNGVSNDSLDIRWYYTIRGWVVQWCTMMCARGLRVDTCLRGF